MLNILLIILLIFYPVNSNIDCNGFSESFSNNDTITIEKDLSLIKYIKYKKDTNLIFEIEDQDTYQINIYSINCNIKIDFNGEIMNKINRDSYSLKMNKTNNNIIISPIIDIIDGEDKENYEYKQCPLSINSINMNKPQLKFENNTNSFFFFQSPNMNLLNISYNIKAVSEDSFVALLFQFNEKSNFAITVSYKNNLKMISKNIKNSTYLFLDSNFLLDEQNIEKGGNLNIQIEKLDNTDIYMHFKIIEKNMISMIEKDALNYGFLTSKTNYQYYYMEVYRGEEGEIMLHNKRLYGDLYAKIIDKKIISETGLNDPSNYPNENSNNNSSNYLKYNPHSLQLKYRYEDTSGCIDGCYILITYVQKKSEGDFPLIGYEFTLLSRSWNYSDYIPQIVDIPFNEYLIGAFEQGSISQHYYSISIPDDAEKIIFQIEGNYIEGYYGEGRQKINTMRILGKVKKLDIINKQNVLILTKNQLNLTEKTITIAIRPKDYFAEIFSFYYFRILYVKQNEQIYFPIDSNLGNLCLPEYDMKTEFYNCYSIFANNYNELSTRFAVSSSNQNEYFKITITKVYKDGTSSIEEKEFIFIYNDYSNDVDYYIFKFEFRNEEVKNIITSFCDNIEAISPQIYSSQMFYLYNFTKLSKYTLINKYTLSYKYIFGTINSTGFMDISFLNFKNFYSNRNFKGKPFSIDLDSKITNISFRMSNSELIFALELIYNMRNKGIEEIKSGETRSQIMTRGYFPLYYYLKIKDENYINLDVNLRLNSYDDAVLKNNFDIKGYLLDEDTIKRKINGEYIQLKDPINGYYSNRFKIGLLEVNKNKNKTEDNNYNYLLIEINNLDQTDIHSELLVELVTKEYFQDYYFMPINQYIIETFDDKNGNIRDKNQYYININQRGVSQVLIELSPEYNDIELNFTDKTNSTEFLYYLNPVTGFKKYRIQNSDIDNIFFDIVNPRKKPANYFIRYYYTNLKSEYTYIFNDNAKKELIETNDENITLSLTFEAIKIIYKDEPLNSTKKIYFYISGLLYKKDENSDELLNTTSILHEQICLFENKTINFYSLDNPEEFTLIFKNIPRTQNFLYDLQIQANVFIEKNLFNEEFLIFMAKIDLTDIKLEEEKSYLWFILGPILGLIVLAIIAFFIIKYIRLQKSNINLKEEMKSLAYSNDIQKNVIVKEKKRSETETDYESTFI